MERHMDDEQIICRVDITRIDNFQKIQMKDRIIDENILEIFINNTKAFEMVFSMTHAKALVAGFLFTQGIVHKKTEIEKIDLKINDAPKKDQKKVNSVKESYQCRVILNEKALKRLEAFKNQDQVKGSSGGTLLQGPAPGLPHCHTQGPTITYDQVLSLTQMHWDRSQLFHETGAVHSAGLCSPSDILFYYEDIGRHNALDKMAGDILLNTIDTRDKIATVSCRMSLEIIGKIIKTGIPIVISNAAPTLSAVRLALQAGLTVVGFARNNRFNIYTHGERILPGQPD